MKLESNKTYWLGLNLQSGETTVTRERFYTRFWLWLKGFRPI